MTRGFTLVEVVVALLLTSLVALVAQSFFTAVLDGAMTLQRSVPATDGPIFGRLWAIEACRTAELGTTEGTGFEGTESMARFQSRLPTFDGQTERQVVTFTVHPRGLGLDTGALSADVVDSTEYLSLDYLVDTQGDGGWVMAWSSPVSAPLAIRVRWQRLGVTDTLFCPIGVRG